MDELVAYSDVVAWQTVCTCGWLGRRWERAQTIAGEYGGDDAEDAFLPDGGTVAEQAEADWSAHLEPLDRLARVREAAAALEKARAHLEETVIAARHDGPQPASWADIGLATGMSRQAAHERWSGSTRRAS